MRFYTVERIGEKRSKTPEGFLLIEDVPLARTGVMVYGPGETPVQVSADGIAFIEREEDEVFREETVASCAGKPVTDNHPVEDVTPANWRQLACGTVFNPRRGSGDQADLLLGDLLITSPTLIAELEQEDVDAIRNREISLGYDAEYDQYKPGYGRQRNIVINHAALLPKGRCGARCSIGDQAPQLGEQDVKTRDERSIGTRVADAIRMAFKSKDEAALEHALKAVKDEMIQPGAEPGAGAGEPAGVHVHLHQTETPVKDDDDTSGRVAALEASVQDLTTRLTAIEAALTEEAPAEGEAKEPAPKAEGEAKEPPDKEEDKEDEEAEKKAREEMAEEVPKEQKDAAMKARDSALLATPYQNIIAGAEILAPGIKFVTFDAATNPRKTYDAMCALRREALEKAYTDPATRPIIEEVLGGSPLDLKAMTCDSVRPIFNAAVAFKRRVNNMGGLRAAARPTKDDGKKAPRTPAELNAFYADYYKQRQA